MPPTRALLLTAGLGTRLRPLSDVRAKPAIPVAGEPFVRRMIRWLVGQGVTGLTLNLHARPETITSVVGDGSDLGATVRYSWEHPVVLGSAGGPRQALDIVAADPLLLINGDTLTNVNLSELARAHAASGARVTMTLVPNREFLRYGGILLDDGARVTGFVSRGPEARGSFHFVGPQLADRDVFSDLPLGQPANSIGEVYNRLLAKGGRIHGHVVDTEFWDIGTVADYWRMSAHFSQLTQPPRSSDIPTSSHLSRCILWDKVEIGRDVTLDECIVTDGVRVPDGADYRRKILIRAADGAVVAHHFEPEPST